MKTVSLFLKLFFPAVIIMMLSSCTKDPGTGGTSSISGKVYVEDYNASFTTLLGEFYATEQRVYIIYGDDDFYADNVRTHYDGSYRFDRLRKGTYTIYAYSKDKTVLPPHPAVYIPVMKTVEITSNNQHLVLEDIIIID